MRQIQGNVALLALALAPLIFGLCTNLVTGGSLAAALDESNLWVFPFLVASGVGTFIFNFGQVTDRQNKVPPDKRIESLVTIVPAVRRAQLALTSGSSKPDSYFDEPLKETVREASPETLEGLVADLFKQPDGEFRSIPYKAAWKLAALMGSSNARDALKRLPLTEIERSRPRIKWLIRSSETSVRPNDSLNIVQGRIGYLIREGGIKYVPPPPLAVDPYIAIGLIAVRENDAAYHAGCPVDPHDDDLDIITQLYYVRKSRRDAGTGASGVVVSESYLEQLKYRDLGKLIRQDLAHTNSDLADRQTSLISHVMRHFLDDELSAILFDALPPRLKVRLTVALLSASQWMSPTDWQHWAKSGRDRIYAQRLGVASNFSFAAAGSLAASVVAIACWQIVAWVSYAWAWYFSSSHFLGTWPGWLKVVLAIAVIVFCIMGLLRSVDLGMIVAVVGVIGVVISILASPVVRVHMWIASWGTASTIVICALIVSVSLAWLGASYSDRRVIEEPVQLGAIARWMFTRVSPRSRFRPDHEVGHDEWCEVRSMLCWATLSQERPQQVCIIVHHRRACKRCLLPLTGTLLPLTACTLLPLIGQSGRSRPSRRPGQWLSASPRGRRAQLQETSPRGRPLMPLTVVHSRGSGVPAGLVQSARAAQGAAPALIRPGPGSGSFTGGAGSLTLGT
jgi:hypothetical protein